MQELKFIKSILKTDIILLGTFLLIIILSLFLLFNPKIQSNNEANIYTLKSYRNCVALYKNEEIIEIYDDIVLSNLPEKDKDNLKNGIEFESIADVDCALKDYDG